MRKLKLNIILTALILGLSVSIYGCTGKTSNINEENTGELPVMAQEEDNNFDTGGLGYDNSSQCEEETIAPGEGGDMLKDKVKGNLKGKGFYIGEIQGENVPFESQIIKTGSYTMGKVFPTIGLYKTVEDLGAIDTIPNDGKYNEEFFKTKALIVIEVQEGSGSIRHEVNKVVKNGDKITVGIKRIVPEIGTADMAEWAIFVEIDKSLVDDNTMVNLVFMQ